MRPLRKRLIVGLAWIAVLDLSGLITMVANPDLTARVIPALFGVQILGFVAIAAIVVTSKREDIAPEKPGREFGKAKQSLPWLFGSVALTSLLGAALELLSIAGKEGRHSWFGLIAGSAMGCFFLWLAIMSRRSASRSK